MSEQRRKHLRLPVASTTVISLISPRPDITGAQAQISCKTVNVSRGGLQVILARELPVGTILRIGVDLPGVQSTLNLASEVRWCLPSRDSENPWMAGLQLLPADDSDIARWAALIASMES